MGVEIADQIFMFARWDICLLAGIAGFAAALWWLFNYTNLARRRISALIDFAWTSLSTIGIASALVVVGDLTWNAHAERQTHQVRRAWDALTEIDGAKLMELNCAKDVPAADSMLSPKLPSNMPDSACVRSGRIVHWRAVEDVAISKIKQECPTRDLKFATRNYEWTKDEFMLASCAGTSECHKARCEQERAALEIMMAAQTVVPASPIIADSTLSTYQSSIRDAFASPLHDIYERTHPIKYTNVFYILIPFWAFFLGARLARSAAELLDPTQIAKFSASWRFQSPSARGSRAVAVKAIKDGAKEESQ